MTRKQFRRGVEHVIECAYDRRPVSYKNFISFVNSQKYVDERRRLVVGDIDTRLRHIPQQEYRDAMAIHPGLRACLNGGIFAICERPRNGDISRSDYLSKTLIVAQDMFDDPNRLLRVYVAFREMACALSVRPMSDYGVVPNPSLVKRYLKRFQNWERYERLCVEKGWKFRYGEIR